MTEAPAGLEPLGEDERPAALRVAMVVCAVLALAVIVGAASVHDLSRHGGSLPGAVFLAVVLALLAQGMYRRRYWAVLGFEALLAFQILVTSLALVVASTIAAAARVPGEHRARRVAVLEAGARDGTDPSRGTIGSARMAARTYDCIVIGSGPGGYVAAIRAAQLGSKTAVIERDKVGGRCLNYACIPAKAVLRSADLLSEIRDAEEYGVKVSGAEIDYAAVQGRRDKVVQTLTSGVAGLFKKDGIDVIEGDATLTADGGVTVAGETLSAQTVILATGSVPRSIPGVEFGGRVIGTEEAWVLPKLPARLAVVGAGRLGR